MHTRSCLVRRERSMLEICAGDLGRFTENES